ncbi:MAG: hypothetical protein V1492_02805 [Candidatus Micrarchaeota archaeon]
MAVAMKPEVLDRTGMRVVTKDTQVFKGKAPMAERLLESIRNAASVTVRRVENLVSDKHLSINDSRVATKRV